MMDDSIWVYVLFFMRLLQEQKKMSKCVMINIRYALIQQYFLKTERKDRIRRRERDRVLTQARNQK